MNSLCQEAQQIEALEQTMNRTQEQKSSVSPNDGLVNLSWPIILILAIAAIATSGQAEAISEITDVVQRLEKQDKDEIILELWKQALIRRVDLVCASRREEWRLDMFPIADRVKRQQGWPSDGDFSHLCEHAKELNDTGKLTLSLYKAALANNADGLGRMFDPMTFRGSSPLVGPNVLGRSKEANEQRAFALARIRERCLHWREHVRELQLHVVEEVLDEPAAVASVMASDSSTMKLKIASALKKRGYPLLSDVL